MKSSLLSLIVVSLASVAVVACHKAEDTAPDAGMVAVAPVVDAAPIATVDPNAALDAGTADNSDAAPPTAETYEKAAATTVTNVQTATAELNKLEQEIGN